MMTPARTSIVFLTSLISSLVVTPSRAAAVKAPLDLKVTVEINGDRFPTLVQLADSKKKIISEKTDETLDAVQKDNNHARGQDRAGELGSLYPDGFQFMYVGQDGQIVEDQKPDAGAWIGVLGSPQTSREALRRAALIVARMLRHSPSSVFITLASKQAGLGIFTKREKLTIFPENYRYADTDECRRRCDGSCSITCTSDGRKYDTLGGLTTSRSVVVEDNVLCTPQDPHHHLNNIVVHEFAHTIVNFGLSEAEREQVQQAYNYAKEQQLWTPGSYAMASYREYFAQGAGVFFFVNFEWWTLGGMMECPNGQCRTETEAHEHLKNCDPRLHEILSHVFAYNQATIPGGLTVCPTQRLSSGRTENTNTEETGLILSG